MPDAMRLLRTLRGLRWRQWSYRPLRRVQARFGTLPAARPAEVHPARAAAMLRAWEAADGAAASVRLPRADAVLRGRFEFVGHAEELAAPPWTERPASPLWSYNLQYFDYATDLARAYRATGKAEYARCFEALAGSWMEATEGGRGPGWEPYPLSLRTVNWMRARMLFGAALESAFRRRLDDSIRLQLAHLRRRLEWHILANHLQKNLHALALGGLYFAGAEADGWRTDALRLLWRELFEQVLPDGGHFERSPMYHAIALGDFLELLALLDACGIPVPAPARERVRRMAGAWARLSRPDGSLHLFNDAAEGIAPEAPALGRLAELALGGAPAPPSGAWRLDQAGYFGHRDAAGGRIVVDCGIPGPRYQPGHAHCDALSFELDVAGVPVVVDSGTSGYDGDPFRAYQRSTRAHSTVQVGEREQSEVWGTFRVGGMARVRVLEAPEEGAAAFALAGECSPWWSRRVAHRRRVTAGAGRWRVDDRVLGAEGARLRSFVHLHPEMEVRVEEGRVLASSPRGVVVLEPWGHDRLRIARGERNPDQGWYAPRFGAPLAAPVVEMEILENDGRGFGYEIRPL
jgi:uncharacterized heparinase superfamily protein